MRSKFRLRILLLFIVALGIKSKVHSQATNNTCANAATLTPANSCTTTSGNLQSATSANTDGSVSGACGSATTATTYDVWYRFTASSSSTSITVNGLGSNLTGAYTPYLEVFNGSWRGRVI